MSPASAALHAPAGPPRARVMIVDDSVVVRGLVARWLNESGLFEVVATASNGRAALDAVARAEPDLVLLDLEMPEMDGLEALPKLLERRPGMQVVVVSTLTQRNAETSLKCLSLGAVDYLPKPETHRQVTTSADFRADLVAKLQALSGARRRRVAPDRPRTAEARLPEAPARPAAPTPRPAATRPAPRPRASQVVPRCLLVGASTGGPRAVGQVLTDLGPLLARIPVLVVQHMPPIFTAVFAEHLKAQTGISAREPQHGERLAPGQIYVAPGGRHMGLCRDANHAAIRLDDGPPVNFCRPAVDVLFRDAAAILGPQALAVVLTGMGADGTQGAGSLVAAGASVLAQDEATSTVWGMPGSVVKAGLAHDVLSLEAMGPAIRALMTEGAA